MAADDFDLELDRARRELRELAAASTGPDSLPHEGYGEAAGGIGAGEGRRGPAVRRGA